MKRRSFSLTVLLVAAIAVSSWAKEIPIAKPESVGMSSAKLKAVTTAVNKLVQEKKIAGAVTMVARKGKIVHFEAYGMRDIEEKKPVEKDTIFKIYSMSKPITSVAIMILVEKGKIKLDDPVGKYIPEFKGLKVYQGGKSVPAKRKMTVRDLLRHSSGLTYEIFGNSPVDQMYKKNNILGAKDLKEMASKLGKLPLEYQPGARWHYSVSTDVLGYVVERASKQKFDAFLNKYIFKPLDMKDTEFFVPTTKINRFSSCFHPDTRTKDKYKDFWRNSPSQLSGGGGLVSTARDYMRFCQMLINEGQLGGKRILKVTTVKDMTKNHLPAGVHPWDVKGLGFGLGFQVNLEEWGSKGGHKGEYSWDGAASTHFWISPKDDLVVIALSQRMPFWGKLKETVKPLVYDAIVK